MKSYDEKLKSKKYLLYFLLSVVYFIILIIVSTRVPDFHNDSIRYKYYFESYVVEGWIGRSDPLFNVVNYLVSRVSGSYEVAFAAYFVIQMLGHVSLVYAITKRVNQADSYKLTFYLIVCLTSTWFYVSTVDGIRQGIALPYLYCFFMFFIDKKYIKATLFYLISVSFHSSSLLILPFILLTFINQKNIIYMLVLFSVGYVFGVNEMIVSMVSSLTGLPIYSMIKNYTEGTLKYYGFDVKFFIYTIFFAFIFYSSNRFIDERYKGVFLDLCKVYAIFTIYYFIFGFAAFSNRYAFTPWNFIPLVLSYILVFSNVKINSYYRAFILFFIGCLGLYLFLNNFSMFWL
ncbi:EpsG family protein [Vibrio splendidus]|uniref:EpsG family protein n=1 Tax=Vibrio splendidus TaxID=29497 RepID=UPI00352C4604